MNNQNAGIDSSQTQDSNQTQRTASNHESYMRAPQFQPLPAGMKARIVKLMQQTMTTFMKAHSNDPSPVHSILQAERPHSRSSLYEQTSAKWNPADIGFFDPHYNDKTIATAPAMEHSEKDTYFRDIHLFLERCSNIATIKDDQIVRNNLFTCLRGIALQ